MVTHRRASTWYQTFPQWVQAGYVTRLKFRLISTVFLTDLFESSVTGDLLWHWRRSHWTNTPGSWRECNGICPQCRIKQQLRMRQCDFVWSRLPVLTCHHNLPCHFISCGTQMLMKQTGRFNTVLYDRSLSRFWLSCFTLRDICLLLLKVSWCWRQSVSTLYSSIKHRTCTFTFVPHLLIAASSVWPHSSSDHIPLICAKCCGIDDSLRSSAYVWSI